MPTNPNQFGTTIQKDGTVSIVIPLDPYTKKNSSRILYKRTADGKHVPFIAPSRQYKLYENDCIVYLKELSIDRPVNVEAHYYMRTRRHVDLTNLNEALHDVLVRGGVLKDDNALIVVSTDGSRVHYDKDNPRTEVFITDAEPTFKIDTKTKNKH